MKILDDFYCGNIRPSERCVKAIPHKDCAADAKSDFNLSVSPSVSFADTSPTGGDHVRLYKKFAGRLSPVKDFLCKMTKNMQAYDVQSR